jgi:putative membrane protein
VNLAGFGFALVAFFRTVRLSTQSPEAIRLHEGAIKFGLALIFIGISTMVFSAVGYWRSLAKLRHGKVTSLGHWPLSISLALLTAIIGLAGMWIVFRR